MSYSVHLQVNAQTYQNFLAIKTALNAGNSVSQAKAVGEVLTQVSLEIVEQVFGGLITAQKLKKTDPQSLKTIEEMEEVLAQVMATQRKYLPYATSLLSNERLNILLNHLHTLVEVAPAGRVSVCYPVNRVDVQDILNCVDEIRQGNIQYIPQAFQALIACIDQGVTVLVREPKALLKLNLLVDKSLNGVINLITHLAYKRLESLANQISANTANDMIDHLLLFLHPVPLQNESNRVEID